jgi:hypothetical protein
MGIRRNAAESARCRALFLTLAGFAEMPVVTGVTWFHASYLQGTVVAVPQM